MTIRDLATYPLAKGIAVKRGGKTPLLTQHLLSGLLKPGLFSLEASYAISVFTESLRHHQKSSKNSITFFLLFVLLFYKGSILCYIKSLKYIKGGETKDETQ